MKKVLKILIIAVITVYFIGNILPNLIGVPLAAYQSYKTWNEAKNPTVEPLLESNSNNKFPELVGLVNDYSQIFNAHQRNELSRILYHYNVQTTRQIIVVTIDSISPYSDLQEYATDLGNEWGVGSSEKNNGLVVVLCWPLKEIGISTGFGTEKILTDEICQDVIKNFMIPKFKNDNYYDGIKAGIEELKEKWKN